MSDLWLWLWLWLLCLWLGPLSLHLPPYPCGICESRERMRNQVCLVCRRHPCIRYLWEIVPLYPCKAPDIYHGSPWIHPWGPPSLYIPLQPTVGAVLL